MKVNKRVYYTVQPSIEGSRKCLLLSDSVQSPKKKKKKINFYLSKQTIKRSFPFLEVTHKISVDRS